MKKIRKKKVFCYVCGKKLIVDKRNDDARIKEFEERYPHLNIDNIEVGITCDDCDQRMQKWYNLLKKCPECEERLGKFHVINKNVIEECCLCGYSQKRIENNFWDKDLQMWVQIDKNGVLIYKIE